MPKKIDESTKQKVLKMLQINFAKPEIAKQCNISIATVFNIAKREKVNNINEQIKQLQNNIINIKKENIMLKNDITSLKNIISNLQHQIDDIIELAKPALNLTSINNDTHQTEKKLLHIGTNSTHRFKL